MAKIKSTRSKTASLMATALRNKTLVKFSRPFDEWTVDGYVLDIGPQFFLLASLGEGVWLDGYQCLRLSDIRKLRVPHPHAGFAEAALRKRGERLAKPPRIDLSSIEGLLKSVAVTCSLVVIHRETIASDSCWIGRIIDVSDDQVTLVEINPDAQWHKSPTKYRLSEITQVSFGMGYEDALYLVGGRYRQVLCMRDHDQAAILWDLIPSVN